MNIIEKICVFCVIVCMVSMYISVLLSNILLFGYSVMFMFAFTFIGILSIENR